MNNTITLTSTGASAWAPSRMRSSTHTAAACKAPTAQHQGTAMPFAGYAAVLSVAEKALRTDDTKVPDPRGRWR